MSFSSDLNCGDLNSTECLLQTAADILSELRQQSGEYSWEPLTFAATLALGIIALVFTALTIVQGLIAAGPGRQKCSAYALGPWAVFSSRRMDWSELRVRSVAHTPIIDLEHLFGSSPRPGRRTQAVENYARGQVEDDFDKAVQQNVKLLHGLKYKSKPLDQYFPATWLLLLTCTGLHHPAMWNTKLSGTDYLPADLAAAPAYASIRDLVRLCAVVSHPALVRLELDGKKKVQSVQGRDFTLDFRYHPVLGLHGVFQSYASLKRHERWFDLAHENVLFGPIAAVYTVLRVAKGQLEQREPFLHPWAKRGRADDLPYDWGGVKSPLLGKCQCMVDATKSHNSPEPGYDIRCCGHKDRVVSWQTWCGVDKWKFWMFCPNLSLATSGLQLLAARELVNVEAVLFPKRLFGLRRQVTGLASLSRFWSLSDDQWNTMGLPAMKGSIFPPLENNELNHGVFPPRKDTLIRCREYVRLGEFKPDPSSAEGSFDIEAFRLSGAVESEVRRIDEYLQHHCDKALVTCRWMSLSCASMIAQQLVSHSTSTRIQDHLWDNSLNTSSDKRRRPKIPAHFRNAQIKQHITALVEIVWRFTAWLSSSSQHKPNEALHLVRSKDAADLIRTLGLENVIMNGFVDEISKFLLLWETSKEGTFVHPTGMVQHPLDDLLIYRAILVATALGTAVDNSEVEEDEYYSKIIPIL